MNDYVYKTYDSYDEYPSQEILKCNWKGSGYVENNFKNTIIIDFVFKNDDGDFSGGVIHQILFNGLGYVAKIKYGFLMTSCGSIKNAIENYIKTYKERGLI